MTAFSKCVAEFVGLLNSDSPFPLLPIFRVTSVKSIAIFLSAIPVYAVHAHGVGAFAEQTLEWKSNQISQVLAVAGQGRTISLAKRNCLAGSRFAFNVRDEYAFDIDETVWLEVEFHEGATGTKVSVSYDGADSVGTPWDAADVQFELAGSGDNLWHRQSIAMDRARFANLRFGGTDFAIVVPAGREVVIWVYHSSAATQRP